jgi:uncharacterized protein YjbI with pentapeptide repeats
VLIYTKLTCVELIFGALTFVEPTFRMLISWELIFIAEPETVNLQNADLLDTDFFRTNLKGSALEGDDLAEVVTE